MLAPLLSPSARFHHAMAYDAARDKTVIWGGGIRDNVFRDTWEWNGTDWKEIHPPISPPSDPETKPLMVYNHRSQKMVLLLFDGENTMWTWDGISWDFSTPEHFPTHRTDAALVYNHARGRVILWGGLGADSEPLSDTWEWNGEDWTQVRTTKRPTPRYGHAMAYDSRQNNIIVFGGKNSKNERRNDTWTFQYAAEVYSLCEAGLDEDLDGLTGCADPDCWALCTPACPPGSTPDWPHDCNASAHLCGDGECNALLETSTICPADCQSLDICGNFVCEASENNILCPEDCTP